MGRYPQRCTARWLVRSAFVKQQGYASCTSTIAETTQGHLLKLSKLSWWTINISWREDLLVLLRLVLFDKWKRWIGINEIRNEKYLQYFSTHKEATASFCRTKTKALSVAIYFLASRQTFLETFPKKTKDTLICCHSFRKKFLYCLRRLNESLKFV